MIDWIITNTVALISAGVAMLALGISIRWHCRRDDREFGAIKERLTQHEKRLDKIEVWE